MELKTRYAKTSDGVNIAYHVLGEGSAYAWPGGVGGLQDQWHIPEMRGVLEDIAQRAKLVLSDTRGFGLSDRGSMDFSREAMVRDIEAVVDAACPGPFVMQTFSWMSIPALAYARENPDRVRALILLNGILRGSDLSESWRQLMRMARENWDDAVPFIVRSNDPAYTSTSTLDRYEESFRKETEKDTYLRFAAMIETWDAEDIVSRVEVPALVCHYGQSTFVPRDASRRLAAILPNATFASVTAEDTDGSRLDHVRASVQDFLRTALGRPGRVETSPSRPPQSGTAGATAIILFTDIVDSTPLTERMGDAAFRALSRSIDERVRAAMREHGGTPVDGKVLGDGVMGVFTSAAQAIAAARACVELGRELPMHIGMHAGDVLSEGTNVYGGAVNIASRICGLCAPGEILVSQTVRDLARTSAGVTFEDRGEQTLKGIEDPVRVFAIGG